MKTSLSENLFGKIMGKILQRKAKKVVKLLSKDPALARQVQKTNKAVEDLEKALKKAQISSDELLKQRGLK